MKKVLAVLLTFFVTAILGAAGTTFAGGYTYITAEDLHARLGAGSPMILIDICPAELFAKGHIEGAIETNAYPVKTEQEKARLAEQLPKIKASADDVIILCPRGGGGAKNTYDFYKANGIDEKRLLILEKGMEKWPFPTEAK
jgi:rhodanese-related sulfurtransferase